MLCDSLKIPETDMFRMISINFGAVLFVSNNMM